MKKTFFFLLLAMQVFGQTSDPRYYEMRIYYAHEGKLADLENRFQKYTTKLFEKNGMENIGYWIPTDNKENKLIYVLAYPSKEARELAWKSFVDSSAWQKVVAETEANGKLVAKVTSIFMKATDFSPLIIPNKKNPNRTFQLRIYTAFPQKISNIAARFKDHTTLLFEKHGIENIAYWETIEEKPETQPKLVYIIAHPSEEEGKANFDAFRKDPEWIKVRDESEKEGKILEKIEAEYMVPTKFSQIK